MQDSEQRADVSMVGFREMQRWTGGIPGNIFMGEIHIAVNQLEKQKTVGLDGIHSEMIKQGRETVSKCLEAWLSVMMCEDLNRATLVPLYKNKYDNANTKRVLPC